jgi:hypothetical protein
MAITVALIGSVSLLVGMLASQTRDPSIGCVREIIRDFGPVSSREKSSSAGENFIAGNSPLILNLAARSVPVF